MQPKTKRWITVGCAAVILLASAWGESWATLGFITTSGSGRMSDEQFSLFTKTMGLCTVGGVVGLWLLVRGLQRKKPAAGKRDTSSPAAERE